MKTLFDVVMDTLCQMGKAKRLDVEGYTMYQLLGNPDEIMPYILGILEGMSCEQ